MASDQQRPFRQLKDGQRLHAAQLFQIADHAVESAANIALASASVGFFQPVVRPSARTWKQVDPTSDSLDAIPKLPPTNQIRVNDKGTHVELTNLAVLTDAGYPVLLAPPTKSTELPAAGGTARFLNAYATSLADSEGSADVKLLWEAQPTTQPRGTALAERTGSGIVVLPLPLNFGAVSEAGELYCAVQVSCHRLAEALIHLESDALSRLRLSAPQRGLLSSLLQQLTAVLRDTTNTPLVVALSNLEGVYDELVGWVQYVTAAGDASGTSLHPDAIGRAQLARRRGRAALPDHLASVSFPPATTTELLAMLRSMQEALTSFTSLVSGESDETALEYIQTYEPWAGAVGFVYPMDAFAGRVIQLRCEVFAPLEPQLLTGLGTVASQPNLRHCALELTSEPGRFECILESFEPQAGDRMVVVLGAKDAKVRVFLRRPS